MARKITIIGAAGRSGSDTIAEIARRKILKTGDELVLVDINERAMGMIGETKTVFEREGEMPTITPVNALKVQQLQAMRDTDIIVMCAATNFPRGGFRTRDWGLYKNHEINNHYIHAIKEHCANAKVIMDTNPVDVLSARFREETGMGEHQVIGKGGDLDTQRLHSAMARHIAKKQGDLNNEIPVFQALQKLGHDVCMIGVHSSDHMLPVINPDAVVMGKPIRQWFSEEELERTVDVAREVGPKSSRQLGDGSPSIGGAIVNCDLIEKLYNTMPREAYVSVALRGKYGLGETHAYACTPAMLSEKGVVEVKEVERVMAMPELRNRLRKGVEDVEERLAKIPAYQKLRDAIGSMPPLNALVDDSGMVILAPHNSGIMAEDQMRGLFRDVRKLLTKPSECQLDVADDKQLRFYYPHPDEVSALLDTLHITPVRNIMQEVERLRAEQERLTTLAVRLHPEGAEALSWQHRTGAGSDIIKRRSGGSGGGTAGGALG